MLPVCVDKLVGAFTSWRRVGAGRGIHPGKLSFRGFRVSWNDNQARLMITKRESHDNHVSRLFSGRDSLHRVSRFDIAVAISMSSTVLLSDSAFRHHYLIHSSPSHSSHSPSSSLRRSSLLLFPHSSFPLSSHERCVYSLHCLSITVSSGTFINNASPMMFYLD